MAWIEQKKRYACWVACWKRNGRKMWRSTGIKVLPRTAGRQAKNPAEQTAKAMELAATGRRKRAPGAVLAPTPVPRKFSRNAAMPIPMRVALALRTKGASSSRVL